jgi:amino acid adenylation domain-containing protein
MTTQQQGSPPLAPTDRREGWPLSFGQQRLWFLSRLLPESSLYHLPTVTRLTGALDVDALIRAAGEIVARHEVLRCRVAVTDGTPRQLPGEPAALEVADVRGPAAAERARDLLADRARRPFDLERGPLVRMCLARVSAREHLLGVTFHHIAGDAWSFDVFFGELSQLYEAFAAGRPSPLPELPVQYGDFATWQRQRLSGGRLDADLDFWRRELDGAPLATELPLDRPRPRMASYAGASVPIRLDEELTAGLRRLARQERCTLFMVLLAAFGVLLTRWTGQEDTLVGVPVAGRGHRDLDGLIGFFVNTVPVRLRSGADPAFTELTRRVRATLLGVFGHQELPFEMLVDELRPERDLGRNPLVQVMFQLETTTPGDAEDGARWEPGGLPAGSPALAAVDVQWQLATGERTTTYFDLSVKLTEADGGVRGELNYATELFDAATASRVAAWYLRILQRVVADPMARVSALTLADRAESGSGAAHLAGADRGPRATIGQLFAAQVDRTPQATAVACGDRSLTYAELWSRADGLAGRLRGLGVGPEVTVGVCAEPGVDLIVAIMGVVLAGGAYVPLAPDFPPERAAMTLDDAAVRVVVTTRRTARALAFTGRTVLYAEDAAQGGPRAADPAAGPDNLLNVIYTSGTTGRPKGVLVRHAHVADYVLWCLEHLPVKPGGSVPLTSSVGFAGVTLALFGSLLSGRRLVVPDPDDRFSWAAGEQEYSFVKLTPSALRYAWHRFGRCWDRWGCVILASEPVQPGDWELARSAPGVTAVVHYGSTETNGSTTWWPGEDAPAGDAAPGQAPPIGWPVSSARVLILDRWGDPVPAGVPGEMFIGGPSVARGYLGHPGLTAERFLPDPFGPPGSRMFRTGDLARRAPHGALRFLGRADRQVKIRGYRVELDGLEQELRTVDGVADAAVTAVPDPAGGLALAAFAVPAPAAELSAEGLREVLSRRLPGYLVPTRLAVVPSLPRTTSGKVDHPLLAGTGPAAGPPAGDPPHTPTEQAMAAIWSDVLNVTQPDRDSNFFTLGGHSLLAVQILARIRDAFGADLPLQVIFEDPTVAGLSRHVQRAVHASGS